MKGPFYYLVTPTLEESWVIPLERIGCKVKCLSDKANARLWDILISSAKVMVAWRGDALMLVYSSLLTRHGKNFRLAGEVERTLLASGAKVYGKPISTNLIYQLREPPNRVWLESLNLGKIKTLYDSPTDNAGAKKDYPCGSFKADTNSIKFWTGAAIDSEAEVLIHYIALEADAVRLGVTPADPFLNLLDLALVGKGAKRIEVQRELDI